MHKKFFKLFIMLTLALLLVANNASANEKIKIVTTFTIFKDMASNVAGDKADVISITKPGADIHTYQPTPGDILKAQKADLILWNGLNLELWFDQFFSNLSDVPSAILTDGILPIDIRDGEYAGRPNPHAWMSLDSALIYVDNIRKAFVEHDPENASTYIKNAEAYKREIKDTILPLRNAILKVPKDRRWLVSCEGAFSYLVRDFKMNELYLWPINAGAQGTPKQVKKVIDSVEKYNIPTVFCESTVSQSPAKQISRETGAAYGGVLYVDSLTKADGPVPSYLDLLKVTSETILAGLSN